MQSRPDPETLTLLDRAFAHQRAGRLDDAETVYRQALEKCPDYAPAHDNLGVVLKDLGRYDEAIEHHRRAAELDPGHGDTHYNLGIVLTLAERRDEAREHYMQAVLINPGDAGALRNLGALSLGLNYLEDAERCLRRAVEIEPDDAEGHANLGAALIEMGQPAAAAEALNRALEIDPDHETASNNLGIILMNEGRHEDARTLFQRGLARNPENHSARHMVAAISGETTATAPREYVRDLFDRYANRFDAHLTGELSYEVPVLMRQAVERLAGVDHHFKRALDLGCGTGMVGDNFKGVVAAMDGIDLSPNMLEKARAKALYERLYLGDLCEIMNDWETDAHRYDIVLSADTFIYVGELQTVFGIVSRLLEPDGLFVFSIERSENADYVLRPSGRYAQSQDYIATLAAAHEMTIEGRDGVDIRVERGNAIPGDLFILRR